EQVGKRRRVAFRPARHWPTEWRQCLGGHYPGRDAGQEILREEGTERLIFPGLEVARRPVVEQAIARDLACSLADRDGIAKLVAGPDEDPQFELIVEPAARAIFGHVGFRRLALALGSNDRLPGKHDRAGAAMITDRHIFIVW